MKFAIANEHRLFFQREGLIEFENFLTLEQLRLCNQAIDQALASRLEVTPGQRPPEEHFLQGRDLSRSQSDLRHLVCQPRFAEVASELVEMKPVRLGYDQLFPAIEQETRDEVFNKFLQQTATLEEISSVDGILCGLMLCLSPPLQGILEEKDGIDIFPRQAGRAIFFRPNIPINLQNYFHHRGQRYLMIVYTSGNSRYLLKEGDPHTHALKRLGYIVNDKLSDRYHPIVYR